MPTDESKWLEMMVESGQMPDENGYWHYNPKAIENNFPESHRGKRGLLIGEVVNGGVLWKNIKTGEETFEQYD